MTVELAPRQRMKLRIEDFDLLAENGGLAGLERTELLDGDIYLMSPQYLEHAFPKSVFYDAILDWTRAQPKQLRVLSEVSVAMPPNDEPIPDVILTSQWRGRLAVPVASVALIVEIADSSRERDLGYKMPLYARQGVPEYWVVDMKKKLIIRHTMPGPETYSQIDRVAFGDEVRSMTLEGLVVKTGELLEP